MDSEVLLSIALILRVKFRTGIIPERPVLLKFLNSRGASTTAAIIEAIPNEDWNEITRFLRRLKR